MATLAGMSYSYSVPAQPADSVAERVDDCISDLPPGPGQREAEAHREAVLSTIAHLATLIPEPEGDADGLLVSVAGHGDERTASVNVSVYRPAVATTQPA